MAVDVKHNTDSTSDKEGKSPQTASDFCFACLCLADDPDLARVIATWPTLSADVKAGIVAMIWASTR